MRCRYRLGQETNCMASRESQLSILPVDLRNHPDSGHLWSNDPDIPGRTIKHREYFHLAKGWNLKHLKLASHVVVLTQAAVPPEVETWDSTPLGASEPRNGAGPCPF